MQQHVHYPALHYGLHLVGYFIEVLRRYMKIKSFEVHGLFGQDGIPTLQFNDDLNILSGRNGAGKTTLLKLMWYLISGNFDKAVAEIKFDSAKIVTDKYELFVQINFNHKQVKGNTDNFLNEQPFATELKLSNIAHLKNFEDDEKLEELVKNNSNKNIGWFLTQYIDSSFFLPTFRMIEGGFTTEKYDIQHDVLKEFYLNINKDNDYNQVENALKKLSINLTKKDHKFITSISAKDIDSFLVKKYAEIMKKVNLNQSERVKYLSEKIRLIMSNKELKDDRRKRFDDLNIIMKKLNKENEILNEPLNNIKESLLNFIPQYKLEFDQKVYFTENTPKTSVDEISTHINNKELDNFDNDPDMIDFNFIEDIEDIEEENCEDKSFLTISNLSAGEKQLLTFIAYNIFYSNTIFFIDEPELSLHVDWQSRLFSLLQEQNPTNQFIISTHSPFIYGVFPDKELVINPDKGCSELI